MPNRSYRRRRIHRLPLHLNQVSVEISVTRFGEIPSLWLIFKIIILVLVKVLADFGTIFMLLDTFLML